MSFISYINDEHVDNADDLDIIMPMYNLIEYSYNYSHTSASLWQFKRDKQNMNNGNRDNVTDYSSSFKNKSSLPKPLPVSLRYLSNFWRYLEML